jgi:pimeloyl-ACP methyl ester carboxylesterase
LPVVLMIGSALNTWRTEVWAGTAASAAEHGGNAPVLVFADATGAFDNDTECVNGSRGNAADNLVKDVVPYMISNFRVSGDHRDWGVAGWSMGGTCALDLTVMHPDKFTAFVDIAGYAGPNVGNKAQTITTLFGGVADRYAVFDPATVITRHGHYSAVAGWFDIPDNTAGASHAQRHRRRGDTPTTAWRTRGRTSPSSLHFQRRRNRRGGSARNTIGHSPPKRSRRCPADVSPPQVPRISLPGSAEHISFGKPVRAPRGGGSLASLLPVAGMADRLDSEEFSKVVRNVSLQTGDVVMPIYLFAFDRPAVWPAAVAAQPADHREIPPHIPGGRRPAVPTTATHGLRGGQSSWYRNVLTQT